MNYGIFLIGTLSLIVSVSTSSLTNIEKTYVKELQENIELIPALLSSNEASPKINVNLFRKLSEAMNDLKTETLENTFDSHNNFLFVNDNIEFARHIWVQYDHVLSFFEKLNKNNLESADELMGFWRVTKLSTKITHDELERLNRYLADYFHFTKDLDIPLCTLSRSRQQVLHDFYNTMTFANLMATVVLAVSAQLTKKNSEHDSSAEFQKFFQRQNISYERAKRAMAKASRSLYACDPMGDNIVDIGVFKTSVLHHYQIPLKCDGGKDAKSPCCLYGPQLHPCDGETTSCVFDTTFCNAPEPKLPAKSLLPGGEEHSKPESIVSKVCSKNETRGSDYCTAALCDCIQSDENLDRYFRLGEVLSDSDENKVVTGVRLHNENSFYYIQIQQGILGPNDSIVGTVEWKTIDNKIDSLDSYAKAHPSYKFGEPNEDFYNVFIKFSGEKSHMVYLDDITPPKKSEKRYAVTGLRFVEEDNSLKLEVETKPYDYSTGILHGRTEWYTNKTSHASRQQLQFEDPIAPIHFENQYQISTPGQFVRFQGTTPKQSLDRTTIPYIDLQEIVTNPPSPVAGAGVLVKGARGSGGYLSLKLILHDIAPPEL